MCTLLALKLKYLSKVDNVQCSGGHYYCVWSSVFILIMFIDIPYFKGGRDTFKVEIFNLLEQQKILKIAEIHYMDRQWILIIYLYTHETYLCKRCYR